MSAKANVEDRTDTVGYALSDAYAEARHAVDTIGAELCNIDREPRSMLKSVLTIRGATQQAMLSLLAIHAKASELEGLAHALEEIETGERVKAAIESGELAPYFGSKPAEGEASS